MNNLKTILVILVLIFASTIFVKSEWFHKEFRPNEYWSKQVESYEDAILLDKANIKDSTIELKKQQLTANLEVAQAVNWAEAFKDSKDEARKEAAENTKLNIQSIREDIAMWKEMLKEDQAELAKAKKQLEKHQ